MKDIYLGIDFGAENIMLSYKTDDNDFIEIVNFSDKPYIKNYYAIDKDKKEYFGIEAQEVYLDLLDEDEEMVFISKYKQDLTKTKDELEDKYDAIKPQELLVKMLRYIKKELENSFEKNNTPINIKNTVITIPIRWKHDGTTIIEVYRLAMQTVGFKNFRIEAEPVAAAANVITLTQEKYKLFGLENPPQIGDNILIVDIGASTLDVNLCKYGNPINAVIGDGNEYAGNYLDALICSYKDGLPLDELKKFDNRYFEDLYEVKSLKEDGSKLRRYVKKNKKDGEKIKHASSLYVDDVSKTVVDIIENKFNEQIDYFVICGGMSQYKFDNFLKNIAQRLKDRLPNKLKNTIFFNDYKEFNQDFLHKTIVNGASMLSYDSELVTRNLPFYLGMIVRQKIKKKDIVDTTRHPIVLINKGTPIKKSNQQYSLIDKLIKKGILNKDQLKKGASTLRTESFTNSYEPIEIFMAENEIDIERYKSKDKKTQTLKFELADEFKDKKGIDKMSVDVKCHIDKDGIVHFEIVNFANSNTLVAKGKLDKFSDIENNLDLRI